MNTQSLQDLNNQARDLIADCRTLDTFFVEGAVRLDQETQVKRLGEMTTRIRLRLEEAESSENGARYASQKGDALGSIGKLIVKGIGSKKGEHFRVDAFEKTTMARQAGRQHTFGNIMVRLGKGGLPDDVCVISFSELARTQNRPESVISLEIKKSGTLLFTPDSFMQLVEGVIRDIRNGKLRSPILPEQLILRPVLVTRPILTRKRIDA